MGRSPKLRQIAAVCGRFTRIALQQQKNRVKHPPDEITSITTGCEIERLLPSEIALLAEIHFSGPNDLRVDLFPKGQATPAEVIACASFFFNGGTVFEPWMGKALELVDGSQFEKADVICVSDGISDAVFRLDDLRGDLPALEMIFSTV